MDIGLKNVKGECEDKIIKDARKLRTEMDSKIRENLKEITDEIQL